MQDPSLYHEKHSKTKTKWQNNVSKLQTLRRDKTSIVDQPWHGLLIAGNHARSIVHRMWEMMWVDATLDFEF